ncbi:hypothetical protein D3C78_1039540 [compost metagenome]
MTELIVEPRVCLTNSSISEVFAKSNWPAYSATFVSTRDLSDNSAETILHIMPAELSVNTALAVFPPLVMSE